MPTDGLSCPTGCDPRPRRAAVIIASLGITLLAACGGSSNAADEVTQSIDANSPSATQTSIAGVSLTMGVTGGTFDAQAPYLIDAVTRLSSGQLRIVQPDEWDLTGTHQDMEREIIEAVAAGDLDLGLVGTRSLTALGVVDFDALIAPMLIDSYRLERAVLDSDIPTRMLTSLDQLGVHGLAVIGGGLRFPAGVEGPFLGPDTYSETTFHVYSNETGAASIAALGATPTDVEPEGRDVGLADGSIDGFENSMSFLAGKPAFARHVTINVALWPATGVLVVSPATLATLDDQQLEWLTSGAADTATRALDVLDPDQDSLQSICDQGGTLHLASEADLAALDAALQPVYRQLATDAATATFIDEISDLERTVEAQVLTVPEGCGERDGGSDPRLPDGTYRTDVLTVDDIVAALRARGVEQDLIDVATAPFVDQAYTITVEFEAGSYVQLESRDGKDEVGSSGTYRIVDATHAEFDEPCCGTTPIRFSLDGDTLQIRADFPDEDVQAFCGEEPIECGGAIAVFEAGPFTRVSDGE
jgi:TRAP-type C4-dicarboxylate transport system substrate-binding protein